MVEIVPASKEYIPLVQEAFDRQRESRGDHFVDYLALPAISDFHRDRLCQSMKRNSTPPFFLYLEQGSLAAIVSRERSSWHSQHYGFPYLKIQPFYTFTTDPQVLQEIVREITTSFTRTPGTVYTLRIDSHDAPLAYALGLHDFIFVGTSIRMILATKNQKVIDNLQAVQYDSVKVRDYQETDLENLQKIGGQNHGHSHFFRELRFPPEKTQALFAEWVQKCARGIAKKVLVAEYQGKIIGFSTLLLNDSLVPYIQQRIGVVDFIVVDQSVQGKGVSSILFQAALAWLFENADRVELRTMAENQRAIRFYEKNGFRILSADHHYHFWT